MCICILCAYKCVYVHIFQCIHILVDIYTWVQMHINVMFYKYMNFYVILHLNIHDMYYTGDAIPGK